MGRLLLKLALIWLALSGTVHAQSQIELSGDTFLHDPSLIEVGDWWVAFATGTESASATGMPHTKISQDGLLWRGRKNIDHSLPEWVVEELGYQPRNVWAPSVSEYQGVHYLYYSVSSFGNQNSAIGLMTNAALDPETPSLNWVDQGLVIRSDPTKDFNAIDAHRINAPDGTSWLSFGSFWDGIRLIRIDPKTGKRYNQDDPLPIASRGGGPIEAPAILHYGDYYYLFVSFNHCCRGIRSTYKIMVGRASEVTGPYLDANGKPMLEGGGTEIVSSQGYVRGPGGQEVFFTADGPMLAFHYYDRNQQGLAKLQVTPLRWTDDGWPFVAPFPTSMTEKKKIGS